MARMWGWPASGIHLSGYKFVTMSMALEISIYMAESESLYKPLSKSMFTPKHLDLIVFVTEVTFEESTTVLLLGTIALTFSTKWSTKPKGFIMSKILIYSIGVSEFGFVCWPGTEAWFTAMFINGFVPPILNVSSVWLRSVCEIAGLDKGLAMRKILSDILMPTEAAWEGLWKSTALRCIRLWHLMLNESLLSDRVRMLPTILI
ncbi:hypothetical protein LY76DRAFT_640356, partial [Colletotrichum caudatum]